MRQPPCARRRRATVRLQRVSCACRPIDWMVPIHAVNPTSDKYHHICPTSGGRNPNSSLQFVEGYTNVPDMVRYFTVKPFTAILLALSSSALTATIPTPINKALSLTVNDSNIALPLLPCIIVEQRLNHDWAGRFDLSDCHAAYDKFRASLKHWDMDALTLFWSNKWVHRPQGRLVFELPWISMSGASYHIVSEIH